MNSIAIAPPALAPITEAARFYIRQSKADNTWRAYQSDFRGFSRWCARYRLCSLPADPDTVLAFVSARAQEGRKISTIRRAVAAIGFVHRQKGHSSPVSDALLTAALQGIARVHGSASKQAPSLMRTDLLTLVGALDRETVQGARDAALLLTGWTMALRRAELIALDVEDLEIDAQRGTIATIRFQKNDPTGHGQRKDVVLAEDPDLCTTRALRRLIDVGGIESGPLFRPMPCREPRRLSKRGVDAIVTRVARQAGLEDRGFTSHSLRAGFATQSARDGKPIHLIQQQTGHKDVKTLMRYIRRAGELGEDSPTAGLL